MMMVVIVSVAMIVTMSLACADTLDMMMMTLLGQSDLHFKTKHLLSILAELAIHVVLSTLDLIDSFHKSLNHHGMIV